MMDRCQAYIIKFIQVTWAVRIWSVCPSVISTGGEEEKGEIINKQLKSLHT